MINGFKENGKLIYVFHFNWNPNKDTLISPNKNSPLTYSQTNEIKRIHVLRKVSPWLGIILKVIKGITIFYLLKNCIFM